MLNEASCNSIAITALLSNDHPEIAQTIIQVCQTRNILVKIIKGANDYWCRDFMPLQVRKEKFVQFNYDPTYYRHPRYCHLKTSLKDLDFYPTGLVVNSPIILDGGNVCYFNNKAIITDKVFRDNPSYRRIDLVRELTELLELDQIIFIPSLPYDITGHSDGMIRFIDENTLYINDFRLLSSKSYWSRLLKSLQPFDLLLLPNELHKNRIKDDATGDYINMLSIKNLLFVPAYGNSIDDLVYKLLEKIDPGHTIIPITVNALSVKGGILHCATWNYFR
jgi:agmatine/peptidylarginine deiminase